MRDEEKELEAADGDELDLLTAEGFFGPRPEAHVLPAEADIIHAASVLRATRAAARPAASKDAWRGKLMKISENLEQNVLQELGLTTSQLTPGLLREYLEKRVPLGTVGC